MKATQCSAVTIAAVAIALSVAGAWADSIDVVFPESYRSWTHIGSMILPDGHFEGIHHIYANKSALKAMQGGTPYPDGAVLVFDLFEVLTKDGVTTAGARKFVDVMQKDRLAFAATGGWGYEEFEAVTRKRLLDDPVACHGCHVSQEAKGFVFSTYKG